jgi:hypothetical protein
MVAGLTGVAILVALSRVELGQLQGQGHVTIQRQLMEEQPALEVLLKLARARNLHVQVCIPICCFFFCIK